MYRIPSWERLAPDQGFKDSYIFICRPKSLPSQPRLRMGYWLQQDQDSKEAKTLTVAIQSFQGQSSAGFWRRAAMLDHHRASFQPHRGEKESHVREAPAHDMLGHVPRR